MSYFLTNSFFCVTELEKVSIENVAHVIKRRTLKGFGQVKNRLLNVGEISGRFEFFQRIFGHSSVSKQSIGVSYTTQRALFNGTIRLSIVEITI